MEQFKTLYKPVLKPVKPGEKRTTDSTETPRFDFAKRFAKMITTETKPIDSINSKKGFAPKLEGMDSKPDLAARQDDHSMMKDRVISGDGLVDVQDAANSSSCENKDKAQAVEFKPVGVPKLNLTGKGLLDSRPAVRSDQETIPSLSIYSTSTSESATSSVPDLTFELQHSEINNTEENGGGKPAQVNDRSEIKKASHCDKQLLDRGGPFDHITTSLVISECRGAYAELERQLTSLEVDVPLSISHLDEKIGLPKFIFFLRLFTFLALLHNLRLDFMLELGNDNSQLFAA